MSYNVLEFVELDPDRQARDDRVAVEGDKRIWYTVDLGVIYPATLARLQEVLTTADTALELFDTLESSDIVRDMVRQARHIKDVDFELASCPRIDCPEEKVERRAEVLEFARKWFTRALRVATKQPIGLHISRNSDWKL